MGESQRLMNINTLTKIMKDYSINNLRNLGIIGHSSSGKTSLTEALLYYSKVTDRLGKVEDGTTISDFDQEEKKRGISLSSSVIPLEWEKVKINLVDIPGYFDFVGESIQGMRAVDVRNYCSLWCCRNSSRHRASMGLL